MSLLWNTGVTQCPNKEFGCTKKFLSEEELDEHTRSCRYRAELSDVISLTKSLHVLEEKMEKMDRLGVPTLLRRLEAIENKSRGETAGRREENRHDLELKDMRDRLVEIEAYNQAIRDDTRVSVLSKRVEQLEKTQSSGEISEREDLSNKFRELKLSFRSLSNDVTQLRDSASGGTDRKRSVLDSGADEGVQKEISELRKKQRSDMRAVGDQVDSLTISTNNTSMELRKIRMKLNSELQVEVNEVKDKLDRVQRTCWSLEDQFAEGKGVPVREGKEVKGRDVSKEVVNQLLDELGVYDSARDMDGVTVELKLLQTKVDLLEESLRGLKLRMRSLRDNSGSQTSHDISAVTEDEGVEKLFDEIRKLKTSLAVTNTELQAGFKRVENRMEVAEGHIAETQQATELLRYPNDSRLLRLEQSVKEMRDTRPDRTADMSGHQMEAFKADVGKRMSRESELIRKELEACQEVNRDSVDVIQQKCNSLYSECSTLNRKVEQLTKQLGDKKSGHAPGQDELLLHLEQGVKELQESYDARLEQTGRQSEELSGSVERVSREVEQIQNRIVRLDTEVRRVCDEEGVMERVEGIEQFLQKDLPSMGLTSSQKATLEKLIEERSDTLQVTLTQEIAEQVVEMRQRIPDISHISTQVEKLESAVKDRQTAGYSAGRDTAERELDDKMDKFQRQVRELDNNAAKIFQSLTADMNKLAPKPDKSHLNRIANLELEVIELRDSLSRRARQEPPKLLQRQTESLDSSVSHASPLPDNKPALPSRALYSNTPPLFQPSATRAPHTSAPIDSYALELIRRAGERYPASGERVMRIPRVHKVMAEQSTILSEPFLSTQDGYQLRLQVSLLSNQSGLRLKIALEIMPTDYDAKLQWPVEGSVKYYVLNQSHDFAHINLDDRFFFSRPTRTSISSKSSILTVPNTDSNSPYCVNDSLFVRTQILNLSNVC